MSLGRGGEECYAEIAAEFIRLNADVIVTSGTLPVVVAKQMTSTIPIVFATAGDPVGNRFVDSLARPGGTTLTFRHVRSNSAFRGKAEHA